MGEPGTGVVLDLGPRGILHSPARFLLQFFDDDSLKLVYRHRAIIQVFQAGQGRGVGRFADQNTTMLHRGPMPLSLSTAGNFMPLAQQIARSVMQETEEISQLRGATLFNYFRIVSHLPECGSNQMMEQA